MTEPSNETKQLEYLPESDLSNWHMRNSWVLSYSLTLTDAQVDLSLRRWQIKMVGLVMHMQAQMGLDARKTFFGVKNLTKLKAKSRLLSYKD